MEDDFHVIHVDQLVIQDSSSSSSSLGSEQISPPKRHRIAESPPRNLGPPCDPNSPPGMYNFSSSDGGDDEDSYDTENDTENSFYMAESLEEDREFDEAIKEYLKILGQDTSEKSEWGLKSIIKLMKIATQKKDYASFLHYYEQFLDYLKLSNIQNIDAVLNLAPTDIEVLISLHDMTDSFYTKHQDSFGKTKTAYLYRLKFKFLHFQARLYLDKKEFVKTHEVLEIMKELSGINSTHGFLWTPVGTDTTPNTKTSQLLETYAMEMQLLTEERNNRSKYTL